MNYSAGDVIDCDSSKQRPWVPCNQEEWSSDIYWPNWPNIEENARQVFFTDYCIVSPNQDISRGYLSGLQVMINEAGVTSSVS